MRGPHGHDFGNRSDLVREVIMILNSCNMIFKYLYRSAGNLNQLTFEFSLPSVELNWHWHYLNKVKRSGGAGAALSLHHHQDGEATTCYYTSDNVLKHKYGPILESVQKMSRDGGYLISRLRGQRQGSNPPVCRAGYISLK